MAFNLSYPSNELLVEQRINGEMHVDDMVLLADNAKDLQKRADTCRKEAVWA